MKKIRYLFEAALALLLFWMMRSLPPAAASAAGGFMARCIGPYLKAHRIAEQNLKLIYPKMKRDEKFRLLMKMWDNLGRVAGELPHLPNPALHARVTLKGAEHLPPPDKPALFFSGHYGNWELTYPILHRHGLAVTLVYRRINNPHVDKMVAALRATQSGELLAKGPRNAIRLIRRVKDGDCVAMLVDQKMNDGVAVPFFGHEAMTATAIAEFALRYDLPIIPGRIIRTGGCRFEGEVSPPLQYEKTGDHDTDVMNIMTAIHSILESWIREHPEQWFWVHRRWPG